MRVGLIYIDALQDGGYPRDVRWLAGQLADLGLGVSLVAGEGPCRDGLNQVDVVGPSNVHALVPSLDILHIWGVFSPQQLWIAQRLTQVATHVISPVAHLMGAHIRRRWWKKVPYLLAVRPILHRFRAAAHLFSQVESEGATRFIRPVTKFEASLGIFPAPLETRSPEAELGDYLLFLGRNDIYQKGMDLLLLAYAAAVAEGLEIPLRIAGQPVGTSTRILRKLIERLGLSRHVQLIGGVSDAQKWRLLANARCLVFPSRWDGPPRPIREAIAMGTPVIVTSGTNLAGLVNETGAGAGVEFRKEQMTNRLLETMDEPTCRAWLNGVQQLRRTLAWPTVARRYRDGYDLTVRRHHLTG
jgi:glycosyltransferase involved in cell wall biosynthesis